MFEIAGYISDGLGTRVEYHDRTPAAQRAVIESVGLPVPLVDVLLGLDDLTRDNLFAEPSRTVLNLTGQPPRSVEARVHEHITRFAPAAVA